MTPGWVEVTAFRDDPRAWSVVAADETTVTHAGIEGDATDVAREDTRTVAYAQLDRDAARERRVADAIAVQAAAAIGADLFITRRPYLHAVEWSLAGDVLIADPDQALPLISLYLRRQRVYITWRSTDGSGTALLNEGLFFWVGTRELLPAGWRWFKACVQHGQHDDHMIFVGQSLLRRYQRALQARDQLLHALQKPQTNDTAEEMLAGLDFILLALMGALDVAARVAHRAGGLTGGERGAAWQRPNWRSKLADAVPALAAVVAPETPGADVLTVVGKLRNSIHGAALSSISVRANPTAHRDTLVNVPPSDKAGLLAAFERLGGTESWGVQELLPDRLLVDGGILADRLLSETAALLNAIMDLTPVERLEGAQLTPLDRDPPHDDTFNQMNRESVRLQIGLPGAAELIRST